MKVALFIVLSLLSTPLLSGSKETMSSYQQQIADRRNAEAVLLLKDMQKGGFTDASIVALDFVFFSNVKADAENLAKALSGNYTATVASTEQNGYWLIKGTTRPYGKQFSSEQWFGWVEFMVSVGFSNNCVFSTWSAYEPKSKKTWSSENVEVK